MKERPVDERMTDNSSPMPEADDSASIELHLTIKDVALLRTGLEMLEDTFGHEEAEELEEVQALLARLPGVGQPKM
jgi:hypothetical protein